MHYTVNLFSTFLENSIKKISDGLQGIMYVDYFQLYQTRFFFLPSCILPSEYHVRYSSKSSKLPRLANTHYTDHKHTKRQTI